MKGFFAYFIAIAMSIFLLLVCIGNNQNRFVFEEIKTELMENENSNKERTLLENNTDKIISTKLDEQIILKNCNVLAAQKSINTALAKYLVEKANSTNNFFKTPSEITLKYLNENSSVVILCAKKITYAEYVYTSNPLLNTSISKKLGKGIITYFTIPIGYSQIKLKIIG